MTQFTMFLTVFFNALTIIQSQRDDSWTPKDCPDRCTCSNKFSQRFQADLRIVDCTDRNLHQFPDSIPQDSQVLLLRSNRISSFRNLRLWLPGLLHLDLADNQIGDMDLNSTFSGVYNLRYLDLSQNRLPHLANGAFQDLLNLEELNLNNNQLTAIMSESFRGLQKLETLRLSGNAITIIHRTWWDNIPSLYTLTLDGNQLSLIQAYAFKALINLRTLNLSQNKIFRINEHGFSGLSNIEYLMLQENALSTVPQGAMKPLRTLKSINLSHNPLFRINAGDFINLPQLKDVSLTSMSRLRLVERGAFKNLPELLVVELHDNPYFAYIDGAAFEKCPSLTHLLLQNNNLTTIEERLVDSLPLLQEISFYGNPLTCDCNIRWLLNRIQNSDGVKFKEAERMVCDAPDQHRFKLFTTLELHDFPSICPPRIISLFDSENFRKLGEDIAYDCRAVGQPRPRIEWVLPNLKLASLHRDGRHAHAYDFTNGGETLILRHLIPEDAGLYTCLAQNAAGTTQTSTRLEISKRQVTLQASQIGSTYATMIWKGSDRSRNAFQIIYRRLSETTIPSHSQYAGTVSSTMKSFTLQNLQPNAEYEACVAFEDQNKVIVYLSCTKFHTQISSDRSANQQHLWVDIERISNVAVGAALGIVACMLIVICLAAVAFKRMRSRTYDNLNKVEQAYPPQDFTRMDVPTGQTSALLQKFCPQTVRHTDNVYTALISKGLVETNVNSSHTTPRLSPSKLNIKQNCYINCISDMS